MLTSCQKSGMVSSIPCIVNIYYQTRTYKIYFTNRFVFVLKKKKKNFDILLCNINIFILKQFKENGKDSLKPPTIFENHNDSGQYYPPMSEAERRIKFFAQSLPNITQ